MYGSEVIGFAGWKGLWSVAEEALPPRGALAGVGGMVSASGGCGTPFAALLETVAVAVHLQNVDMVGESVKQSSGDHR